MADQTDPLEPYGPVINDTRLRHICSLLETIHANQIRIIIPNEEKIMAALDDLDAAVAGIQAAVDTAVTLIMSLHSGSTVTDAAVEAEVAKLQAASAALGAAKPQP